MMPSLSISGMLAAGGDELVERIAGDVLHDDERHAVLVAEVVNDNDVGMLQDSGLRFAIEALEHFGLAGDSLQ